MMKWIRLEDFDFVLECSEKAEVMETIRSTYFKNYFRACFELKHHLLYINMFSNECLIRARSYFRHKL